MKLYILEPVSPNGWAYQYDVATGFVVAAQSPIEARRLAAGQAGDEGSQAWLSPETATCRELKPGTTSGVVIRDYNAG